MIILFASPYNVVTFKSTKMVIPPFFWHFITQSIHLDLFVYINLLFFFTESKNHTSAEKEAEKELMDVTTILIKSKARNFIPVKTSHVTILHCTAVYRMVHLELIYLIKLWTKRNQPHPFYSRLSVPIILSVRLN